MDRVDDRFGLGENPGIQWGTPAHACTRVHSSSSSRPKLFREEMNMAVGTGHELRTGSGPQTESRAWLLCPDAPTPPGPASGPRSSCGRGAGREAASSLVLGQHWDSPPPGGSDDESCPGGVCFTLPRGAQELTRHKTLEAACLPLAGAFAPRDAPGTLPCSAGDECSRGAPGSPWDTALYPVLWNRRPASGLTVWAAARC